MIKLNNDELRSRYSSPVIWGWLSAVRVWVCVRAWLKGEKYNRLIA